MGDMPPGSAGQGPGIRRETTWFGPDERPLHGVVYLPLDGEVRGAVVIAPALGKEAVDSYRGVGLLAQKLAGSGLLVFRFDYLGTGDSFGEQDSPGAVRAWKESVRLAVDYVRAAGVEHVALVGLRVGGLLAWQAAADVGVLRALVLWDPVLSGRAFLRQQSLLYEVATGRSGSDGSRVSIVGAVLEASAAEQLSAMDVRSVGLGVNAEMPVLLAVREDSWGSAPVRDVVSRWKPDELRLQRHDRFLEPPDFLVDIPVSNIVDIARWLDGRFGAAVSQATPRVQKRAVVGRSPTGQPVVETMLRFGADGLYAIRTELGVSRPVEEGEPGEKALLLHGTASEHRIGPVRMWVEVARELAGSGLVAYRFDRRGTGDADLVADDERTTIYTPEFHSDSVAAATAVRTSASHLVMAGVCSGAWSSSFAALEVAADAVVLINMTDWAVSRRPFVKQAHIEVGESSVKGALVGLFFRVAATVKEQFRRWLPYRQWLWLGSLGLIQVPELMLRSLWCRQVRTTAILAAVDYAWFLQNRGDESLRKLEKEGWGGAILAFEGGDHSLYDADFRHIVRTQLARVVIAEVSSSPGRGSSPIVGVVM